MKRLVTILTLWIWLPTAAAAGEPRTHIDEALVKFVAAFNAGDAATVAGLYTEDAALFPPGGARVDGRAAIQAFWQGAIDSGMKVDDLHAVEVEARGNIAGEIGVFTLYGACRERPDEGQRQLHRHLDAKRPHVATSSRHLEHQLKPPLPGFSGPSDRAHRYAAMSVMTEAGPWVR